MPGEWAYRLQPCSSLARHFVSAQYRHFSTHVPGRNLRGDDLGPTRRNANSTFRIRKDGAAKELPLPPSLDPVILEKRSLWEQTKQQPKFAEFTPFQKKLWENPFGNLLLSTIRHDILRHSSPRLSIATSPVSRDQCSSTYRTSYVPSCTPTSYHE